jgi:hypothetical protein
LVADGLPHPEAARIFRLKTGPADPGAQPLRLHQRQRDAIVAAQHGGSYVLTTGTGSGKSLSYLVPAVDRVLHAKDDGSYEAGIKAIIARVLVSGPVPVMDTPGN